MEESEDLYELLGLPGGVDGASIQQADLKRAWRRRCLEWHPDKRPGDATAAAKFNRINSAFEVLSDAKARKAYDELQLLKKRREEQRKEMGAKRRKLVDDLHKREASFELQRKEKAAEMAAEVSAAAKLKDEISRIREKNAQRMRRSSNGVSTTSKPVDVILNDEDKDRSLKVKWDASSRPDYTAESLRGIFQRFGPVEDVVLLDDTLKKKKKRGVALVVMVSTTSAYDATQSQCGHLSNPLLVIPVGLPSRAPRKEGGGDAPREAATREADAKPPAPSTANHATLAGSGFGDREDLVLRKLKEAQERKRKMEADPGKN